jgi:hypothetical protein
MVDANANYEYLLEQSVGRWVEAFIVVQYSLEFNKNNTYTFLNTGGKWLHFDINFKSDLANSLISILFV